MSEPVRLQKFLSQAGIASRRAAEGLILEGRVRVNGAVARELGVKVDRAADVVEVDGRRVRSARTVWLALHKPRGYVSTRKDPQGRRTIYDLVPEQHAGLFYVGRLDVNSEGLMLLTNDGDTAHRLLHPSFGVERVYDVEVEGDVASGHVRRLLEGVELEDGPARAERVERLTSRREGRSRLRLKLREGRNREVRRMLEAVGLAVRRLIRVRYGPVRLGDLPSAAWRPLSGSELSALRAGKAGGR